MSFDIQVIPNHLALTGRIKSWLKNPADKLPVSCTSFTVEDSIEGPDGIDDSLIFTSYGLRHAQGVAINLSKIRPSGTENGKGLVASGPSSFALEYSLKNQVLRRGGTYKNGAVNLHLDYRHADVVDFVLMTREELPWAYRTLDVDENFITHLENQEINRTVYRRYVDPQTNKLVTISTFYKTALDAVIGVIKAGDLFLSKLKYDENGNQLNSNVCVTDTTWVETTKGPKQVKELIDTPFTTIVNGKEYKSISPLVNGEPGNLVGFYPTGYRLVYTLKTQQGYELELTSDHKVLTDDGFKEAIKLKPGDKILLNNLNNYSWEGGLGNNEEGWLLGQLVGDGSFAKPGSALMYFYGEKQNLLDKAINNLNQQNIKHSVRYETANNKTNGRATIQSKELATLAKTYNITKDNKKEVTELIESGSMEFYKGFLQGLFDADACVTGSDKTAPGIQITQVNLKTLQVVQRMLRRFNITSCITKNSNSKGLRYLPDSDRKLTLYNCQQSYRLNISGRDNLLTFKNHINFSFTDKTEKLEHSLTLYKESRGSHLRNYAIFKSLEYKDLNLVYDCTIEDIHQFSGNMLLTHQCLEVYFKPKGTCTLSHLNLGSTKPEEIPTAMKDGMIYLCELHSRTNVGNDGKYLSHLEDKQVGLGVIGLANLLANEDVKYLDFVKALEHVTELDVTQTATPKAMEIASYIYAGYKEAAVVAKSYGMRAGFCVAPTATCSYQYTDRLGYTTTPEIAPPINVSVERDSDTFGTEIYYYPDNVETAEQVGYETFFRLNNVWQYMMNLTGLAHSISTNWWADKVEMNKEFLQKWLDSYHMSLYYSLNVATGTLDKSSVITLDDLEEGSTQNINPACSINKQEPCIPCGE